MIKNGVEESNCIFDGIVLGKLVSQFQRDRYYSFCLSD